ncbi:hypothetical protein PRIPAC_86243 [Pristionchus pacificus]|nr:hypothetical protein PRIPAC_86243 [Pristionchus pacificus]
MEMLMHVSPPKEEDEYHNLHFSNSFLELPDEIIEKIFFYLDFADRCEMRGMNKRFYGIEDRMKNPLENRRKLEIIGEYRTSTDLNITIGEDNEKVSLDEAVLLIHRFANIFKFNRIVFSPSEKQHLKLLEGLSGIATDLFRIPAWFGEYDPNHLANEFDRSTICNLMQKAEVVKILRVCAPVKAEDLLYINERAHTGSNFCGIAIKIPRETAIDFMKKNLGEKDKTGAQSWVVVRNEGKLEMKVERCGDDYTFGLYNSECEDKYPMLRSNDLYEDSEYDSEEDDDNERCRCDSDYYDDAMDYEYDYDDADYYREDYDRSNNPFFDLVEDV